MPVLAKILVVKEGDKYVASIENQPNKRDWSPESVCEAIGRLVLSYRHEFLIEIDAGDLL